MKAFSLTHVGNSDITALEIQELLNVKSKSFESGINLFDLPKDKLTDLAKFCYSAQSIFSAGLLFQNFSFTDLADLKSKLDFGKFPKNLFFNKTFAVSCNRIGSHDFTSQDIGAQVGEFIFNELKKNKVESKVKLSDPDIPIFVYIFDNELYLGLNFIGFDVSKRDYRIFNHLDSIKGTLAYSLARFTGLTPSVKEVFKPESKLKKNKSKIQKTKMVVLDPFCASGTTGIESACFLSSYSVNFFAKPKFAFQKFNLFENVDCNSFFEEMDSEKISPANLTSEIFVFDENQKNVRAAEKNAKLANVNKILNFSRTEVEWLDTKFEEKSVDFIISNPPRLCRTFDQADFDKLYSEFFYVSKHVLKSKGKIGFMLKTKNALKDIAEKNDFKMTASKIVFQGKDPIHFVVFEKV
ncbi:RNA methyltransferase [Candidatus Woesearchaeota archaeon]|jgi:23S rRNA G2445 N2-methylase RlmL|nr:RNA methyltransferase [Candidatus Woesearchaeota archaeon]